jgi:hypothetical protein
MDEQKREQPNNEREANAMTRIDSCNEPSESAHPDGH